MNGKKIMIVDDSKLILQITKDILENEGYQVITRENPIGTTAAIRNEKPDCLLLDVNMPGLSGSEVMDFVNIDNRSGLKIILHSSMDEEKLRQLTEEKGADGFIKKTNNRNRFILQLKTILENPLTKEHKQTT